MPALRHYAIPLSPLRKRSFWGFEFSGQALSALLGVSQGTALSACMQMAAFSPVI